MNDYFIENISIKENVNIQQLDIPLSKDKRKHLIFTGKNGCGKTTTLKEINTLLTKLMNNGFASLQNNYTNIKAYNKAIHGENIKIEKYNNQIELQNKIINVNTSSLEQISQCENNIKSYHSNIINCKSKISRYKTDIINWQKQIDEFAKVNLVFSNQSEIYEDIANGKFILAYFEAKRENNPTVPNAIQNVNINQKNSTDTRSIHKQFISYMVRLRNTQLNEEFDGDKEKAELIKNWFINFENTLKKLFKKDDLKLKYNNDTLNFKIEYENKSFGLNELSDGYSSLLAILTELILRMEAHSVNAYDMQGIVLIDEIETHLHVELQKEILPFLVDFFPKIQFIVTTHSPFVLSSLSDVVICDLEKSFITEDLTGYSYESLVDSFFDTDKYSQEVKDKLTKFEELTNKNNNDELIGKELKEYLKLEIFFETLPKFQNEEIGYQVNRIQQLKTKVN